MEGILVETKLGLAVRSEYLSESGIVYVSFRLVNGCNGNPRIDSEVQWSGGNTWDGIGFTVATDALPETSLAEEIKPTPKRKKTK
jgi:hypothetical protein